MHWTENSKSCFKSTASLFHLSCCWIWSELEKVCLLKYVKINAKINYLEFSILDGSLDEMPPASLNQMPDEVLTELIRISEWLFTNNKDEFMTVYARIRATILMKSLQQLKEQQRSSSGGSLSYSPLPVTFWFSHMIFPDWLVEFREWSSKTKATQRHQERGLRDDSNKHLRRRPQKCFKKHRRRWNNRLGCRWGLVDLAST